jgi:uncharacterized protein (TIGR03086 family)
MNEVDGLIEALRVQVQVVERLAEPDLTLASACPEWSVGEVLQHSVGVTRKFTDFAAGRTDSPKAPAGDLLIPDHRTALQVTEAAARQAWTHTDLTRTCHLPFGSFSASEAAGINLFDVLAHTWDVAVVADIAIQCHDELWVTGLWAAEAVLAENRDRRHYGPEQSSSRDRTPSERFLAYLGRGGGPS